MSVYWNQRDTLFIQFVENQGPLHASSITCLSSGGATQMAFGILRAYNVSWLWHVCSFTATFHSQLTYALSIPIVVCAAPPEDEQVMLETCRGPWFSINWMKSASRFFELLCYTRRVNIKAESGFLNRISVAYRLLRCNFVRCVKACTEMDRICNE
jgi:hypothetical protein